MTGSEVSLNIIEIRKPEIDAKLIADNIAQQLERRVAFRRAMKRAVQSAMRLGALGIRINCCGSFGRRGNRASRMVPRRSCAAAHAARRDRFRRRYGEDHLRHLRCQGLGVQGRDHGPRPDGHGQARPWNIRRRRAKAVRPEASKGIGRCFLQSEQSSARPTRVASRAMAKGGYSLDFGAFGMKAMEPGRITARADRSGPPRHHASHEACRQGVDPHFPGRAGQPQARRSPHGLGQGYAGILGLPREAGPHHVRDRRRAAKSLAEEAFTLAAAKLPIKTRLVGRLGEE